MITNVLYLMNILTVALLLMIRSCVLLSLPLFLVDGFTSNSFPSNHQLNKNSILFPIQRLLVVERVVQRKEFPVIWNMVHRARIVNPNMVDLSSSSSSSSSFQLVSPDIKDATVSELLSCLNQETQNKQLVDQCIEKLEEPYREMQELENSRSTGNIDADRAIDTVTENSMDRFKSLIGWYDVKYVKPSQPNENPVGGKWTRNNSFFSKVLRLEKTYQHILPVNSTGIGNQFIKSDTEQAKIPVVGEAINVLVFQALWGLLSVFVILRGDAIGLTEEERYQIFFTIPLSHNKSGRNNNQQQSEQKKLFMLSSLAVRALFDSPRIVIISNNSRKETTTIKSRNIRIWMNLMLGPKSSVVLDTSYVDRNVRIGVGGRSGTRFVFQKYLSNNEIEEANEFQSLLQMKPWKKQNMIFSLVSIVIFNTVLALKQQHMLLRVPALSISLMTSIFLSLTLFSTGGIENNRSKNSKSYK